MKKNNKSIRKLMTQNTSKPFSELSQRAKINPPQTLRFSTKIHLFKQINKIKIKLQEKKSLSSLKMIDKEKHLTNSKRKQKNNNNKITQKKTLRNRSIVREKEIIKKLKQPKSTLLNKTSIEMQKIIFKIINKKTILRTKSTLKNRIKKT